MSIVQTTLGLIQELKINKMTKQVTSKEANKMLLAAKVAIHLLETFGPDYAIWQNAKASHKALKQIKKQLELIG